MNMANNPNGVGIIAGAVKAGTDSLASAVEKMSDARNKVKKQEFSQGHQGAGHWSPEHIEAMGKLLDQQAGHDAAAAQASYGHQASENQKNRDHDLAVLGQLAEHANNAAPGTQVTHGSSSFKKSGVAPSEASEATAESNPAASERSSAPSMPKQTSRIKGASRRGKTY